MKTESRKIRATLVAATWVSAAIAAGVWATVAMLYQVPGGAWLLVAATVALLLVLASLVK
jgi:hypothetical protein